MVGDQVGNHPIHIINNTPKHAMSIYFDYKKVPPSPQPASYLRQQSHCFLLLSFGLLLGVEWRGLAMSHAKQCPNGALSYIDD